MCEIRKPLKPNRAAANNIDQYYIGSVSISAVQYSQFGVLLSTSVRVGSPGESGVYAAVLVATRGSCKPSSQQSYKISSFTLVPGSGFRESGK